MTRVRLFRVPGLLFLLAAAAGLFIASGAAAQSPTLGVAAAESRMISGATVQVGGRDVTTWARLDADDSPVQVGVTVAYGILANPPAEAGTGPAGAIAVVEFPKEVQSTSVLNHFAIHWLEGGHTPDPFLVSHFDFHFYGIPSSQVARIGAADPAAPDASRLPAGYVYGGPEAFVPQMGGHALNPADLGKPFSAVLILGYYEGRMIFVEPMVTQEFLRQKSDFAFDIPEPQVLGGQAYYPTRFAAHYDPVTDSYQLILSDFRKTRS
jgi:hypothetical protein